LIRFKLDTGAAYGGPEHCDGPVKPTQKKLFGPGQTPLNGVGVVACEFTAGERSICEDLYIGKSKART
jgi:hypothetical protein